MLTVSPSVHCGGAWSRGVPGPGGGVPRPGGVPGPEGGAWSGGICSQGGLVPGGIPACTEVDSPL